MVKKTLLIFLIIIIVLSVGILYYRYVKIINNFVITPSNITEKEIFLQEKGHYFYVTNDGNKEIIEVKKNQKICTIYDYEKSNLSTLSFFISHSLKDKGWIKYILFVSPNEGVMAKEIKGVAKKIEWVDDNRLKVNLVNGKEVYLYDPFNSTIFEKIKETINRSF